uniref:NADH dehydrogenase subunit 2 n=1 Tax=Ischnodemus noctulus TaxID=2969361 RepID=UPI002176EC8E|nr:NADH dehydrogenase subunit 2 [Ischnodemus noctulus]UUJ37777.1 NADH dehydrogenase subunit 2 [Ischnodemus noctulus]
MNMSNLLFVIMLILSTIISMSSSNWMGIWMGMEMNLMSFIAIISKSKNLKSSKATMIYFLAQSLGSITLLFFILMSKFYMLNPAITNETLKSCIMTSLIIKMGLPPFHWWYPMVMKNLMWTEALILMTWQKLIPIFMISMMGHSNLLLMSIVLSSLVGAMGGMNYTSMMKIMAFSSINNMSWIMLMMIYQTSWVSYFMIYSLIMMMSVMFFNKFNVYYLNQNMSSSSITEKLTLSSIMLSLGGLPPFLGFMPKWIAIQSIISSESALILIFMVIMSLLTLFYYIRMMTPMFLFYTSMNKYIHKKSSYLMNMIMFSNLMLPLFLVFNF